MGVSVIQKTLNPLHVHRLRKCLDAFHNDYRGRKQNLLVLGKLTNSADPD